MDPLLPPRSLGPGSDRSTPRRALARLIDLRFAIAPVSNASPGAVEASGPTQKMRGTWPQAFNEDVTGFALLIGGLPYEGPP